MSSPEGHEVSCLGFGKKHRALRVWSAGDKVVLQAPPGEVAFLSEEEVDLVISALLEARKQTRQAGAQWIANSGGAA
jgi:hypothetical protein